MRNSFQFQGTIFVVIEQFICFAVDFQTKKKTKTVESNYSLLRIKKRERDKEPANKTYQLNKCLYMSVVNSNPIYIVRSKEDHIFNI